MRCESVARVSCDPFISCRLYGSKISSLKRDPIRFEKEKKEKSKPFLLCCNEANNSLLAACMQQDC